MKALRVQFATQRFVLRQAHVGVNHIRFSNRSPTTVGGLRNCQIAMVGELGSSCAGPKNDMLHSSRTDHTTLHAQVSSDRTIKLNTFAIFGS